MTTESGGFHTFPRRRDKPFIVLPGSGNVQVPDTAIELARGLREQHSNIYVRAGVPVEVVAGSHGVQVKVIEDYGAADRFERYVQFVAWRNPGKKGDEPVLKPTTPSVSDLKMILKSQTLSDGLRPLELVSQCALLVDRGAKLEVLGPGYHEEHRVYIASRQQPNDVPPDQAIASLVGLLEEFDFATDSDYSRALASIFTPALVFSGILHEQAPMDIAEADHSQSGKTYRHKLVRAVYDEDAYPVFQRDGGVGSKDESLSEALLSAKAFVAFDNFRGRFDSQFLEGTMTWGKPVRVRVPYRGEVEVDPSRVIFQLSSNGAETTADLANRAVITRIRKRVGHIFKKYPEGDLLAHVRAHQLYYLGCVFSVIRGWHEAGRPLDPHVTHDRREWASTLSGIIEYVTAGACAPLMGGHQKAQERVSNRGLSWLRKVCLLIARDGLDLVQEHTASELAELSLNNDVDVPGIRQSGDDGARAVGTIFGKLFRESDKPVLTLEGYTVTREQRLVRNPQRQETVPQYVYWFARTHPSSPPAPLPAGLS